MNKILALAVCTVLFSSCMISQKKSYKLLEEARNNPYDIIVVPGVPYEDGEVSFTMSSRIYWSKYLYDEGITKRIMYSGSAVYSPYYEAKIMALVAKELGIPDSVIYTETKAEHSTENIYYSYKKAKLLGFERIALATDPFQAKMLKTFIKIHVSKEVGIIPFFFDSLDTVTKPNVVIPDSLAYKPDFVSITERESWFKRFAGTRGKNIDKSYYNNSLEED